MGVENLSAERRMVVTLRMNSGRGAETEGGLCSSLGGGLKMFSTEKKKKSNNWHHSSEEMWGLPGHCDTLNSAVRISRGI